MVLFQDVLGITIKPMREERVANILLQQSFDSGITHFRPARKYLALDNFKLQVN
jgi:hypothetical protein